MVQPNWSSDFAYRVKMIFSFHRISASYTLGAQKTDQKTMDGLFQTVLYYRVMAVISTLIKYKSRSKIGLTDLQRNNLMVALEKERVY